jgi:hypothetical protein
MSLPAFCSFEQELDVHLVLGPISRLLAGQEMPTTQAFDRCSRIRPAHLSHWGHILTFNIQRSTLNIQHRIRSQRTGDQGLETKDQRLKAVESREQASARFRSEPPGPGTFRV